MSEKALLLEMRGISKAFPGVKALDNVSLKVYSGTVHALLGENGAGKSTLMKCLFGIYKMDSGDILLNGENVHNSSPHDALKLGISMVHQELEQVRERNVMDNIWLGRYPKKGIVVDEKRMFDDTKNIFMDLNINIDPRDKLSNLTVSQRQMIEIAKAMSYESKIIAMDEPTSSLSKKEIVNLFEMIHRLKNKGIAIIYITHKLEEIFEIADDVTILRDGKFINTLKINNVTNDQIVQMITGRDLTERYPLKNFRQGEVLLEVKNLSEKEPKLIQNISFVLHSGEIIGIAGLLGAGRTELLETIFGIRKKSEGQILFKGREIDNNNPENAIKNGFALCTEERRYNGIFPDLSVAQNAVILVLKHCKNKFRFLSNRKIKEKAKQIIHSFDVKTPNESVRMCLLSGGNQQKLIIGKWLLMSPTIILMDDPTRGIDVGAKFEIYKMINDLARDGKGIILTSSEMPELMGISDKIIVLSNGKIADVYDLRNNPENATQENIFKSAIKYL